MSPRVPEPEGTGNSVIRAMMEAIQTDADEWAENARLHNDKTWDNAFVAELVSVCICKIIVMPLYRTSRREPPKSGVCPVHS